MGILTNSQVEYYNGKYTFTGDGTTTIFTLSNNEFAFPHDGSGGLSEGKVEVFIDGVLQPKQDLLNNIDNWDIVFDNTTANTSSAYLGWYITFTSEPTDGVTITVSIADQWGNYQFTNLENIINNFMIAYTGEDKIISKVSRTDVQFHAQRALAELSFDTLRSSKSQEIAIPPSLTMILPHDYVNYIKLTWTDPSGIKHVIYPASKTSNPFNPKQNSDGSFSFDPDGDGVENSTTLIPELDSDTWSNYKSSTPSENQDDYIDDTYWPKDGNRYGIDPQHAQANGSFFIDQSTGLIHFSSNISGKTVILDYISDSLGTNEEMIIHKLAEDAMYKSLMYAILSTRSNVQEFIIQRYKKERFAAVRKAKLRLSNIKLEELTQILRGKSKFIKH